MAKWTKVWDGKDCDTITYFKIIIMKQASQEVQTILDQCTEDRKPAMLKLREVILKNLPKGFEEAVGYGMIGYCVPHSVYPAGYHCNPEEPLPFIGMASQKNHISFYHMGIYASPELLKWFQDEFPKHSDRKLDMGKSCIRFKKPEHVPYELLGELVQKMTPEEWISLYESTIHPKGKKA